MHKILLIEDEQALADLLVMMLKVKYQVFHVAEGNLAFHAAKEFKPDLIILDVMLPGMDGYTVQNQFFADETLKDIPIIISSSKTNTEELFGPSPNVACFIAKPFSLETMSKKIDELLNRNKGS